MKQTPETMDIFYIRPVQGFPGFGFRELWAHRHLMLFLVWRELKARYQQTLLGASWAILQPVLLMLVFSLLLSQTDVFKSSSVPYFLFAYAGLVPWILFSNGFVQATMSFSYNRSLVTKVYIPKLTVPLAAVFSSIADCICSCALLVLMLAVFNVPFSPKIFLAGGFLLLAALNAAAIGIWLSALNVKYHDIHLVIPFLAQLWLLGTPVAVPLKTVSPSWQFLWSLNPMTAVIEGFRWSVLPQYEISLQTFLISLSVTIFLFITGLIYFRTNEPMFSDVI